MFRKIAFYFMGLLVPLGAFAQGGKAVVDVDGRQVTGFLPDAPFVSRESGVVVVSVRINRYGEVFEAKAGAEGTTLRGDDIFGSCETAAFNTHFDESSTAPVFQDGRIRYLFEQTVVTDTVVVHSAWKEEPPKTAGMEPVVERTEISVSKSVPHLRFKKHEIDGSLAEYMNKMVKAGFKKIAVREGIGILAGPFAGEADCRVFVVSSDDRVWKVLVDLPGQDSWPAVKKQYLYFKGSYAAKYSVRPKSVEKFPHYTPEGSGREHNAFREEVATYSSTYNVPNGSIVISVMPVVSGKGKMHLRLEYIDEINSFICQNAILEDI